MKMDRQKFEQSCAIKFHAKLDESTTVTYEKLQRAYGEHSLYRAQVFRWHKSFLVGREQVEDEPHVGRISTSKTDENVERVRSLVRSDHRLMLRMISSELNLNWCVYLDLLDRLQREPEFFSHVITGDESQILEYDPETKLQSREWHTANSPRPKKARMSKSKIKLMLICLF